MCQQPNETNSVCPIDTDRATSARHSLSFGGKTVQFCCQRCKKLFLSDPSPYLKNLPQFTPNEIAALTESIIKDREKADGADSEKGEGAVTSSGGAEALSLYTAIQWIERHRIFLIFAAGALCLNLAAIRLSARMRAGRDASAPESAFERQFTILAQFRVLAIVLQAGFLVDLLLSWWGEALIQGTVTTHWVLLGSFLALGGFWFFTRRWLARRPASFPGRVLGIVSCGATLIMVYQGVLIAYLVLLPEELIEGLKRAADYRQEMSWQSIQEARDHMPKRLQATYYRGNDERSEKLFNNGSYRTADFRLRLQTEGDQVVTYGAEVAGKELELYVEIVRAPFTTGSLFKDAQLQRAGLILQPIPFDGKRLGKYINFSPQAPGWSWSARCPLGKVDAGGKERLQAVVYLCDSGADAEWVQKQSAHYGIQVSLLVEDGRVQRDSHLWMASLYFASPGIPRQEWFSHHPIPVLPGKNTDDPALLGIDRFNREQNEKKLHSERYR
jgi:YHS domain-containing protein